MSKPVKSVLPGDFITLFEFILRCGCHDVTLLGDPMSEAILVRRRYTVRQYEATALSNLVCVAWQSFQKTPIFQNLVLLLPVCFLNDLSTEFDMFYKTPSSLSVRLSPGSDTTRITPNEDLVSNESPFEIKSCLLVSGKRDSKTSNVGGNLQKLTRLKDKKQRKYLLELLEHSRKSIFLVGEDMELLTQLFRDVAMSFRKLNPLVLLPIKCTRDVDRYDCSNLQDLCKACVVDIADICKFVSSVIITSIPLKSVFGSCKFRRLFIRDLLKLIRGSSLYDSNFLTKLPFEVMSNCLLAGFVDRPQVISNVLFVIVRDMLLPLLKDTFYIAKSGKSYVFHYKPLWTKLQDLGFQQLSPYFSPLEHQYVDYLQLSNELFGIYSVRIQPKPGGNGTRLISLVNKTCPCEFQLNRPINANLVPTLAVLKSVWKDMDLNNPQPIKGSSDLVQKISDFKTRVNGSAEKLYYFKIDAKSCYDNISLAMLQTEVLQWLSWDQYYHLFKVRITCHQTHRSYIRNFAIPCKHNGTLQFEEVTNRLDHSYKSSTITLIKYKVHTKDSVMRNIKSFLNNSIVYHSGMFYRRKTGIPQGAKVSKILCDFYFNYLFRTVSVSPDSLFISATDDFLFVSTNKSEVDRFMFDCFRGAYDFILNKQKTESYLDNKREIYYYGIEISMTL